MFWINKEETKKPAALWDEILCLFYKNMYLRKREKVTNKSGSDSNI